MPSQEKWVILSNDGSRLVYGDPDSERNTVEYVVRWGNWIGNSSLTRGQGQQAMRWNLSEVRDIFDNALTYTYQSALQYVGSSDGKQHTEANYLSKITNPQGQTVTLVYEEKAPEEYQDPHTEKAEPDAYQERYERLALDQLEVRDESGALRYTLDIGYQFIGVGSFTKRLLTSVQKIGENGTKLPPLVFDYERSGKSIGTIKAVTTSQGGTVRYTRAAVTVNDSERMLTIRANEPPTEPGEPEGPDPIEPEEPEPIEPGTPGTSRPVYAEPQTWIGPDYVVVAWRALKSGGGHTSEGQSVKLAVYQWNGRWIETIRQTISNVGLQNGYYQDFDVVLRADFFAVKHDDNLYLSHKDSKQPGKWLSQNLTFEKDNQPSYLVAGENFVVVGGQFLAEGELSAWRWDGDEWDKNTFNAPEGDYAYTAANNYFIAHDNDPNPDRIRIYYLDKEQVWRQKSATTLNSFTSGNGAGSTRSNWYGTNSFAVVLADDNEEFIYQWDEEYTLKKKAGILGGWVDEFPVYLTGNNLIGLANRDGNYAAFRYDGANWIGANGFSYKKASFGEDFFFVSRGDGFTKYDYGRRFHYDPNTQQWEVTVVGRDLILQDRVAVAAGTNFGFYDGWSYYRNPEGEWELVNKIADENIGAWAESDFQLGGDNVLAVYSAEAQTTYVLKEEYSEVTIIATLPGKSVSQREDILKASSLVGSNIVVTFPAGSGNSLQENARSLTLHKLIDGQLTGPQIAYPVQTVTVESGPSTQYLSYQYTTATATMSAGGGVAQFNKVRVIPGVNDPSTHPYGYTEQYFFNGLSSSLSSLPFPTVDFSSSAAVYYGKLLGLPYASQTYDKNDALVAESKSYWQIYQRDLSRVTGPDLAKAYLAQVVRSEQSRDGVSQRMDYDYGDDETATSTNSIFRNGQVRSMSTTDSEGRTRTTRYQYAFDNEAYSSYGSSLLRESRMLSYPVIQTVSVDGTVTQKSETYYQALSNDASSVVPQKTVAYPRGESKSVTVGYRYDDYGNMIESRRAGGLITAILWGYDYSRPVAQAVGVTYETLSGKVAPGGIQDLTGSALQSALSPLRTIAQARVSTTAYDRLYGITSETDPNGRSNYYEYDDLGRMYLTRNQENNITGKMEYGYYASTTVPEPEPPAPEPEPCTATLSVSLSGSARVTVGGSTTFTAAATGCGSFTYQWGSLSGQVVSSQGNRATILFNNCGPSNVTVTVKDANGKSRSDTKPVTVDDPNGNKCDGEAPQSQPTTPTLDN